jgi:hypothetical protein
LDFLKILSKRWVKNWVTTIIIEENPRGDMWYLGSCLGVGHTPCAHVVLGLCLSVGHIQRTHSAWALASVPGTPYAHMALGLLLVSWALPSPHVALGLCWFGDKWCLSHVSGRKGNGSGIKTHNQWV